MCAVQSGSGHTNCRAARSSAAHTLVRPQPRPAATSATKPVPPRRLRGLSPACQLVPVSQRRPSQPLDLQRVPAHHKENQQVGRAPGHAQTLLVNGSLVGSAVCTGQPAGAKRPGRGWTRSRNHRSPSRRSRRQTCRPPPWDEKGRAALQFEAAVDDRLGRHHAAVPVTSGFRVMFPLPCSSTPRHLNLVTTVIAVRRSLAAGRVHRRRPGQALCRSQTPSPHTCGRVHKQPVLPTIIAVAIDQLLQLLRRLAAQARVVSVSQVSDFGGCR
jgi:hypothetical protein